MGRLWGAPGDLGYVAPTRFAANDLSIADREAIAVSSIRQDRGTVATVGGAAIAGLVDLVDTAASSVPGLNKLTGVERGELNAKVLQAIDMPGLTDFYNDNRGAIEVASGIEGVIVADVLTRKLTKPAGALMKTLARVPAARRIATLDRQYWRAMARVRRTDRLLARNGAQGVEQFVGVVPFSSEFNTQFAKSLVTNESRSALRRKALLLGSARGVKDAALTEATMALTLNQNGFLYDDDAAHNLMWMGLGLAGGAGVEWLHGAYLLRKHANSDLLRREFANALDPTGFEEQRLLASEKAGPLKKQQVAQSGYLRGAFTDRVTSLLMSARNLVTDGTGSQMLLNNRRALATQHEEQALEELVKVTSKGIETDGHTRFTKDTSLEHWQHVKRIARDDAAGFYGVEMLGGLTDSMTFATKHEEHMRRVQARLDEAYEILKDPAISNADHAKYSSIARQLRYEQSLTPVGWVDGERMSIDEAEAASNFVEPAIVTTHGKPTKKGEQRFTLWETAEPDGSKHGVGIDSSLDIHLPGGKTLDNADYFDVRRLYRAANKAMAHFLNSGNPLVLPKNPSWFLLDMAEELLQRSDGKATVLWPKGLSREQAQVESFAQKAEALRRVNPTDEIALSKLRVRYNLPKLTAFEQGVLGTTESPVDILLRGAGDIGPDSLRRMSLPEVQTGVAKARRLGDMAPASAKDEALRGNSFSYMLDPATGQTLKPLIGYVRPFKKADWTQDTLIEHLAARKMFTVAHLMGPKSATMSREMTNSILSSEEFDRAARPHELADIQIQGTLTSAPPQTVRGTLGNAVTTAEFRDRDNPILLAARRLNDMVGRITRAYMRADIEEAFQGTQNLLANPRNAGSRLLLNQFFSFRSGWDLSDELVPVGADEGTYAFRLAESSENQARWRQAFDEEMPTDATLRSPKGVEIVVDGLGLDLIRRYNQVTDIIRDNKNTLRRSQGLPEIERVSYFTPPPNTDGKYIGFTIGPDGRPVPNLSVIANTQEEFDRAKAVVLEEIERRGLGYTFQTRDQLQEFADVWDRAQMDLVNPSTTAVQGGRKATGALQGFELDNNAFESAMKYLETQYIQHGNDMIKNLMKDQINAAKSRSVIASTITKNNAALVKNQKFRNVHDLYLQNLLGQNPLNSQGSLVGRFFNAAEGAVDSFLADPGPLVRGGKMMAANLWDATNRFFTRLRPWDGSPRARKDFETLSRQLGEHMPFKTAHEMAERQGAGSMPPELKRISAGINQFTAAMLLRVGETAHALMNLTGIVNASPSVIRHVTPRPGESQAAWASRIGHSANLFNLPNGQQIGIVDMAKIVQRGFKNAWDRKSHVDYDFASARGYLSQEVAELQKQFGAIKARGDITRFFLGDPASKNKFTQKGLVGWLSTLSDKSEDFSRSWAHMVGLELADTFGVVGREARHSFAHDIANKMIANYDPLNRPEVFQGAFGAQLGLFQSFIFNYYQRLFRYIETKDGTALATQAAMQSSLFGVTSLPGWTQFNDLMFSASEGEEDPASGIFRKFGPEAGAVLANGVLSNIPTLFGADAVDLYSRGDTNIRLPGFNPPPAVTVAKRIYEGLAEGMGLFSDANPGLSSTRVAEIASNMIVNRPIAGIIEQFAANGNDTDSYGQLVSETRNWMEATYRIMGLRSQRQSRELDAFYTNKNAQTLKAAQDAILRKNTRAALRAGEYDALPGIFDTYLANGGDPSYFRRWLKMQYAAATSTRAERQLDSVLHDPAKMAMTMRLLDAQVGIQEAEEADDPAALVQSSPYDSPDMTMQNYGNAGSFVVPNQ